MTENGEILPHSAQGPGTLLSGDVSTSPGAEENFFWRNCAFPCIILVIYISLVLSAWIPELKKSPASYLH